MRTAVAQTSRRAYEQVRADGRALTQAQRVLAHIEEHPRCSRNDIAEATGIRLSSVCGRVNELLEAKLVRENGTKYDPTTRAAVNLLEPVPDQGELFGGDGE